MENSRWETFSLLRIDVPGGQGEPRASRGGKARRARGSRSSVQAHSRPRTGLVPGPAAASGVGVPVLSRRGPCAQRGRLGAGLARGRCPPAWGREGAPRGEDARPVTQGILAVSATLPRTS